MLSWLLKTVLYCFILGINIHETCPLSPMDALLTDVEWTSCFVFLIFIFAFDWLLCSFVVCFHMLLLFESAGGARCTAVSAEGHGGVRGETPLFFLCATVKRTACGFLTRLALRFAFRACGLLRSAAPPWRGFLVTVLIGAATSRGSEAHSCRCPRRCWRKGC